LKHLNKSFQEDVENIGKITIIPNLLDVVCEITGMGFAAIARVTEEKWMACYVRDDISFGLKPGDELAIDTTICNEIRQHQEAVIIDHVTKDELFKYHHTPAQYGFQSYISVPIMRKDNTFFGTLCAIDPNPHYLSKPEIIKMFRLFCDLISFHLDAIEQLDANKVDMKAQLSFSSKLEEKIRERTAELDEKNETLLRTNKELQEFNYISSHDLQEPLRKIQTYVSKIQATESSNLSSDGTAYFQKVRESAQRMQSLINDLLTYSQTQKTNEQFKNVDLRSLLSEVLEDLTDEINEKSALVNIGPMCSVKVIPFQFRQIFYNIIGNAIKYSSEERQPRIEVISEIVKGNQIKDSLPGDASYCHIRISDNGIGFNQDHSDKIFELFQRLHNKSEFSGTGIGLAIVKKIIENHKGFITAKSATNEGAAFDIYFPLEQ